MTLSLSESQAVNEIAAFIYDFLPGTPHPYADADISFPGAAQSVGLGHLWRRGSKQPAITTLLEQTLKPRRGMFCDLMIAIVRRGMTYRNSKGRPIMREEIRHLNGLVTRVGFKIPELWDPRFLDSLPVAHKGQKQGKPQVTQASLKELKDSLLQLNDLTPQARGYAFEKFLQELFQLCRLKPRKPFRLVGEQIDGSFQVGAHTYLLEAKWHSGQIGADALFVFQKKVERKASWSRGLFVSYGGFTSGGLQALSRGGSINIIGMDARDLYFVLEGEMELAEAIDRKARRAAETGEFFVSVYEIGRISPPQRADA
jgi:hypothetical protein